MFDRNFFGKELRMKQWMKTAVIVMCVAVIAGTATMAIAAEKKAGKAEFNGLDEFKGRVEKAVPWFKATADHRARYYYDHNAGLNKRLAGNERNWGRFRTRVGAIVSPFKAVKDMDIIDLNIRMAWEWRQVARPVGGTGNGRYPRDTKFDEALFDIFNITFKKIKIFGGDSPVSANFIIGRQEIQDLGSGWLIMDGTPLDGSRTNFFDAVRATIDLKKDYKSVIDLVYIDQSADTDRFIRPINDWDRNGRNAHVTEQNERGAIFYLANKYDDKTQIDGYFIFKHDMKVEGAGNHANIYTFGCRAAKELEKWDLSAEIAPQFGKKNTRRFYALGGRAKATYKFKDKILKNHVSLGYEFRSGGKHPDKNFDILWGRYCQWSDLYNGGADALEDDAARSSNLHRIGLGWGCEPLTNSRIGTVKVQTDYNLLLAARNNADDDPTNNAADFSDKGAVRGHLVTAVVKHDINKHIEHQVRGDVFVPGNFYSSNRGDTAIYARYQLILKW